MVGRVRVGADATMPWTKFVGRVSSTNTSTTTPTALTISVSQQFECVTHELIVGHAGPARSCCFVALFAEFHTEAVDGLGAQRAFAHRQMIYAAQRAVNDRPGPVCGVLR